MLPPVTDDSDERGEPRWDPRLLDRLPDVRDGLTRLERVILWQLHVTQKERHDRHVPTAMLYGRVCEHVDVSVEEFQHTLSRLVGAR
jgi:DNA gyrase/topoisomerase IV subunit A